MTGMHWGCLAVGFIAGALLGPMLLGMLSQRGS